MKAESGGRTTLDGRPITSRAGAMGLMQLMPGTWAEMRRLHRLGADPHQPRDNILAGTAYLRAMYDRFGYPGLFAAYNAGPRRYEDFLAGRSHLPRETIAYLHQTIERGRAFAIFAEHSATMASQPPQATATLVAAPPSTAPPILFVIDRRGAR